ncbi:uncharacterized protein At2g29880 isoform X3 [Gossypium hirsutum]|uniref:Uncharacterized protein At2g29880 isoform X3 n=1 Tax=Gossypium hirsutum TaxID=3635 RepID=A0A1U8JWC3_GOSHI|nr:uncharacterized protein At2g29880-like isoform X3 [Gossypium hirsutum]
MIAISCFLRLRYYSPSYKVRPERHHQWNLLILLVKKSFIYLISSEADSVHVSLLTTFFPLFLDAMFTLCYCFLFFFGLFDCFLHPQLNVLYSLNHFMSGFSQSSVSSQNSRGTKRKWVPEEDVALVTCMVDLHNVGTFNVDTGFKAGYLNELKKMLEKVLPNTMLKAKPNLESRIRTLKRDWSIVYDMLSGKNTSDFGWDEHKQLVVAEDVVWNSYINSHKEAGQFKHHSFPYYDQLTVIYAKDRATGKDAQTATDVIEEIDVEDVATTNTHEERNDFYGCEADVSLDDMDLSATQTQPARNKDH